MYQIYQIEANDTIASIANKFNTTIEEIRKINGLGLNYMLMPGSYIVIPNQDNELYTTYIVQKGDNLYSIAGANNTTVKNLILLNGLKENDYIYPNQELLIPREGVTLYITENETLNDIATKLGTTPINLIDQNERIYLLPEQLIIYKKRENV